MDFPYYIKDSKKYERITHVLDYFSPPELVNWKIRVGRKEAGMISRAALRIGENVDDAIRCEVEGRKVSKLKTLEAQNCWEAFRQWKKDHNVKEIGTLNTVFNDELMVAGTPDLFWADTHVLIDVKCSSAIRPSYWLQTEFYSRNNTAVDAKAILRLDKNLGIYEYKEMSLSDEHWEAVRGAIKLYRYYKSVDKDGNEGDEDERDTNTANAEK